MNEAKKGAARLLGCYRTGDANDPETYIAAVVAVLEQYPINTIRAVTAPATGIASKLKWLPSIAEIKEACEAEGPSWSMRYADEWERGARAMIAQRETLAIADQRPRKTYAQLVAECQAVGIMIGPKKPASALAFDAFCEKYKISKEQWDAIPNAKDG